MKTIYLDGTSLTFDQVYAVAYGGADAPRVEISAEAARLVARAAQAVQTLLERGVIAYGITTGFGADLHPRRIRPPVGHGVDLIEG